MAESGYLVNRTKDGSEACYYVNQTGGNYFQSTSALTTSLPLFVLQLSVVLFTTRLLLLILRPLRQPSIVALIIVRSNLLYNCCFMVHFVGQLLMLIALLSFFMLIQYDS